MAGRDLLRLLLRRPRQRGAVQHVSVRLRELEARVGALGPSSEMRRDDLRRSLPSARERDLIGAAARSGQQPGVLVEAHVEDVRRRLSMVEDSLAAGLDSAAEIGSAIEHLPDLIPEAPR